MTTIQTQATTLSVQAFLDAIADPEKRTDAMQLCELMQKVTSAPAVMWGEAIIGFGSRVLVYDSGRTLDWFVMGFSPRKANFSIYLSGGHSPHADLLKTMGKHKTAKGCFYINKLKDIDVQVFEQILLNTQNSLDAAN